MGDSTGDDAVPYRALLTDQALLSVLFISSVAALGNNAVPVALPRIGAEFQLTESEIGLVMSTFGLSILLVLPVVSVLSDMYGRRAVVIPSLVVFGLSGLATFWATDFPALLALRVLQGVGFAGTLPLTPTLTGDLYTGPEGSAAQGIRSGLNGLAGAVAPIVAGVLAVVAWQYPFALFALALPAAAFVYRYYPEPVERSEGGGGSSLGELRSYWTDIREAATVRLSLLIAGGFALFFLKGGFNTFLPVVVVTLLGAPVTTAGTVLGVYGATRVVISPLSGSIMVRLGRRSSIVLGAIVAAVGLGAIPFAPNVWVLGVVVVVFAAGEAVLNPVINDAVAASTGDEQRAGIMSALQTLKNFAVTVSPVLMGAIIGVAGYGSAFLIAAAVAFGYGVLLTVYFLRSNRRAASG